MVLSFIMQMRMFHLKKAYLEGSVPGPKQGLNRPINQEALLQDCASRFDIMPGLFLWAALSMFLLD